MEKAQRKKIMWILNGFLSNGITMFVINYLTNLDLNKFEYYLGISGDYIDQSLLKKVEELNVKIVYLPCRKRQTIEYFFKLKKIVKNENIDIVHIHGNSATVAIDLLAAKQGGCKRRIAHCHNSRCDYKKANKLLKPIFNRVYTCGIACSEEAALNMFGKVDSIRIIKNGIDTNKFCFNEKKRKMMRDNLNILDKDILLGHVGAFNNQKNQEFLIELIKKLIYYDDSYKLVLVGEGEKLEFIKKMAKDYGVDNKVLFLGKRDDIAAIMCIFDIFVFPSKFEGLGIAAIEAQSTGIPCIASEEVPLIARVTDNMEYLKLDVDEWCKRILNDNLNIDIEGNMKVKAQGWDIRTCANELQMMYMSIL